MSRRILLGTTALTGTLLAAVSFLPVLTPWIAALRGPWADARGDILIVLGGDDSTLGMIGLSSYWRAVYATWAWREGEFREIVISGYGAVASMRDFMVAEGVPEKAIRLEAQSHSTRENALFVARLLQGDSRPKVLLTSDFHMRRAAEVFRKCGVPVAPHPVPDAIKRIGSIRTRWPVFLDISEETAKLVWYRLRGWL